MTPRGDDGQIGGMEAMIFGVLVFVIGTLLVANTWSVIDAKMAASAAAREATRTFVEASDEGEGRRLAKAAAREAIRGHGRDPERMRLAPAEPLLERCERVTMTVTYPVPIIGLPVIGRVARTVTVSASHAEIVDPYRSGLTATDECARGDGP